MKLTPQEEQMLYLARLKFLSHEENDAFFLSTLPTLESLANDPQAIEKMASAGIPRHKAEIMKRWGVNFYPAWEAGIPEFTPEQLVSLGVPNTGEIIMTIGIVFQNIYTLANALVEDVQLALPALSPEVSDTIIVNAQQVLNSQVSQGEPHLHQVTVYVAGDADLEQVAQLPPYDASKSSSNVDQVIEMLKQMGVLPQDITSDDAEGK